MLCLGLIHHRNRFSRRLALSLLLQWMAILFVYLYMGRQAQARPTQWKVEKTKNRASATELWLKFSDWLISVLLSAVMRSSSQWWRYELHTWAKKTKQSFLAWVTLAVPFISRQEIMLNSVIFWERQMHCGFMHTFVQIEAFFETSKFCPINHRTYAYALLTLVRTILGFRPGILDCRCTWKRSEIS